MPPSWSLNDLESAFLLELSRGPVRDLESWLSQRGMNRPDAVVRLSIAHFAYLWRNQQGLPVELWVNRYPALADDPQSVLQLIACEIQHMTGEPELAAYLARFPSVGDELRQLFEVRELLDRISFDAWIGQTQAFCTVESQPSALDEQSPAETERSGDTVALGDAYQLLRKLASGHWKDAYEGLQLSTRQRVAVKLPRRTGAGSEVGSQMLREGRTQALLSHQSIPPIFAVQAEAHAEPILIEKLIVGQRWSDSIAHLSLEENLRVLLQVARATAYAHVKHAVIHRDIKPDNAMLNDEFGEVYLVDWGLALRIGDQSDADHPTPHASLATGISGTPAYMAPEMALGQPWNCSPATDVFLLGGVLYQILTGQPPYEGANIRALLFAAARGDITPPRQRTPNRAIPVHLERISMKALAFDQQLRYVNAAELVTALEAYLHQSHAEARCTAAEARLKALCETDRKTDGLVTGSRQAALGLIELANEFQQIGQQASHPTADHADPSHEELLQAARQGEQQARTELFRIAVRLGDLGLARTQYELLRGSPRDASWGSLESTLLQAERRRRRQQQAKWFVAASAAVVVAAALVSVSESRRRAVAESVSLQARAEAAQTRLENAESQKQAAEARAEAVRNRTLPLAVRAETAQNQQFEQGRAAFLAESLRTEDQPSTRQDLFEALQRSLTPQRTSPRRIAGLKPVFDHSGEVLVTVDRFPAITRAWSTRSWRQTSEEQFHEDVWVERPDKPAQYLSIITDCVAVPGRPGEFFSTGADGNLCWFDALHRRPPVQVRASDQKATPLTSLAIRRDGPGAWTIAVGDAAEGSISWWNWSSSSENFTPQQTAWHPAHSQVVLSLAFSPRGDLLASGGPGQVRLWSAPGKSADNLAIPPLTDESVTAARVVRFSPGGKHLVAGTEDNRILVWDLTAQSPTLVKTLLGHQPDSRETTNINGLAFLTEEEFLSVGSDGTVRRWDLTKDNESETLWQHAENILGYRQALGLAVSPNRDLAVSVGADGVIQVDSLPIPRTLYRSHGTLANGGSGMIQVTAAAVNAAKGLVALSGMAHDTLLRVIDTGSQHDVQAFSSDGPVAAPETLTAATAVALHPDGTRLVSGERTGKLALWEVSSGKRLREVDAHPAIETPEFSSESPMAVASLDWSPDGTEIVSLGFDGVCKIWNAETLEVIHAWDLCEPFQPELYGFVPRVFYSTVSAEIFCLESPRITSWNRQGVQLDRVLEAPAEVSWKSVAFSRNEKLLAIGADDGSIEIRDWNRNQKVRTLFAAPLVSGFSPYIFPEDDAVRLDGLDDRGRMNRRRIIDSLSFSPNQVLLAATLGDGTVRLFEVATGRLLHSGAGHQFGLADRSRSGVWFSPAGQLYTWSTDGAVREWDLNPFAVGRRDVHAETGIAQLAVAPDGQELTWVNGQGQLFQFPLNDRESAPREVPALPLRAACYCEVAGRRAMCLAGSNGRLFLLDSDQPSTPRELVRPAPEEEDAQPMSDDSLPVLAASPVGELLASNHRQGGLDLWSLTEQRWLERIGLEDVPADDDSQSAETKSAKSTFSQIHSVAFSPDGLQLACANEAGHIGVWHLQDRRWLWRQNGPKQFPQASALCYSPDGQRLAQAGFSPGIVIWNAETGERLQTLQGHESRGDFIWTIRDLHWTSGTPASGPLLVSAGGDDTVRFWREQGELLEPYLTLSTLSLASYAREPRDIDSTDAGSDDQSAEPEMSVGIRYARLLPDGKHLLVGDSSDTLKVYDVSVLEHSSNQSPDQLATQTLEMLGLELNGSELRPKVQNRLLPEER